MWMFAAGASVLANLASLGRQFAGVTNPNYAEPVYVAGTVTNMGGHGLVAGLVGANMAGVFRGQSVPPARYAELYREKLGLLQPPSVYDSQILDDDGPGSLRPAGGDAQNQQAAMADDWRQQPLQSPILVVISFIDVLQWIFGSGPIEKGESFLASSAQFGELDGLLGSAVPDKGQWSGGAADAYARDCAVLKDFAARMGDADLQLGALIEGQSETITRIRVAIGVDKDLLAIAYAVEVAMWHSNLLVYARRFSQIAAGFGFFAGMMMVLTALGASIRGADRAHALAAGYQEVSAGLAGGGGSIPAGVDAPAAAFGGDFGVVSGGTSAGSRGKSGFAGSTADGGLAVSDDSVVTPSADEATGWSGPAAGAVGNGSLRAGLMSPTPAPVSEVVSTGQRGRADAAPGGNSVVNEQVAQKGERAPIEGVGIERTEHADSPVRRKTMTSPRA